MKTTHKGFDALDDLVARFSAALLAKLKAAREKYGHGESWLATDWRERCLDHLHQHIAKGDPRDVAAYCAFLWHHGWRTEPASEATDAVLIPRAEVEEAAACVAAYGYRVYAELYEHRLDNAIQQRDRHLALSGALRERSRG